MLSRLEIARLLEPFTALDHGIAAPDSLYGQLEEYLSLILKWNDRTNLTSVREPEAIVRRHFGESIFLALHLGATGTLLDFGSGAGFPGIPIQLVRPEIAVTLAESQGKKAAFLREAVRTLGLATEIYAGRVETMPGGRRFDVVTLRAVDRMEMALSEAGSRAISRVAILGVKSRVDEYREKFPGFGRLEVVDLPLSTDGALVTFARPHG
jgi:16S rRNA (guanine527-N7)-methyltransferase